MALNLAQARELADRLTEELNRRTPEAERLGCYYSGDHPLKFASDEFAKFFAKRYQGFSDNWTQVVADSPVERLTVTGFKPYGAEKADKDLWRVWMTNGLDADSQLAFLDAGVSSRSFALVWNPDNSDTPTVTFEDATQAIVAYRAGSRRERVAALKRWQDGDDEYCTLYLPDQVFKFKRATYQASQKARKSLPLASVDKFVHEWVLRDIEETGDQKNPQPNPMGVVPMVELQNRPRLADDPISDIAGVVSMQDAINLLWALTFNGADFASLAQRVVLGAEMPTTPILNDKGEVIGERPVPLDKFALDRVLWVPDKDASIANWPEADLKPFMDVIEVAVGHVAAQTRTPAHYLIGKMANLSGDALIAAEAGLVKRCEEKQLWYGQALREVFRLIALAKEDEATAQAAAAGTVMWADPESRNVAQLTDSLLKLKTIGFPFEFLAARYNLTPTEIADLMAMREREAGLDPIGQLMNGRPELDGPPEEPAPEPDAAEA
ncbi:phage portal protein [Actinomadura sp. NPDC048032]|uniref:phage portal protein n=1 Tax=Actinomadura sp. NPDC048032 TaxID=3155747 RepID=UPI0033E76C6B